MKNLKQCLVIGSPIEHSISPLFHNTCYSLLGLSDKFTFDRMDIDLSSEDSQKRLISCIKDNNVVGISVTTPNKKSVFSICTEIEEDAKFMDAVNTVVIKDGKIIGHNNDWIGIYNSVKDVIENGASVAILGSGGSTSAAAYGLAGKVKKLSIFARNVDKAKIIADKFNIGYSNISNLDCSEFDLIINTTTCGFNDPDSSPIDCDLITAKNVVFDIVYNPFETKLIKGAKRNGARVIYGTEMLINLAARQFFLYTGFEIDSKNLDKVRNVINSKVKGK